MRIRKKNKQSKKDKKVTLILEKDGEIKEIELNMSKGLGALRMLKKITNLGKEGWQLKDVTGDPQYAQMFMGAVHEFQNSGKIPVKTMLKSSGLSAVPQPLRKLLKKDELDQEKS